MRPMQVYLEHTTLVELPLCRLAIVRHEAALLEWHVQRGWRASFDLLRHGSSGFTAEEFIDQRRSAETFPVKHAYSGTCRYEAATNNNRDHTSQCVIFNIALKLTV